MKFWKKTLIFLTVIMMVVLIPLSQTEGAQDAPLNDDDGMTNAEAAAATAQDSGQCGLWNLSACAKAAIYAVGGISVTAATGVMWIANEIFNLSINLSIRGFADYDKQNGVQEAWKICRDVANMFFIFIMLYIAIGSMLEIQGVNAKQMVTKLIIVALFINFSAVVPRIVIDASNLLALQFYEQMGDGETVTGAPAVTKAIISRLGFFTEPASGKYQFTENYANKSEPQLPAPDDSMTGAIVAVFGKIIFILVTAFMLLAGAWMFLFRTVALIFVIILSPLAFFAYILPKTQKYFYDWWNRLINEAFFAPAYLFLMYIVINIVKKTDLIHNLKADNSGTFNTGPVVVALNFAIIIAMMGGALIIARTMTKHATGQVDSWAKKARGFGMGLVSGAAGGVVGAAGVYTLGRKAQEWAGSDRVKNLNKTTFGRLANDLVVKRGLDAVAKSKFGSGSSYQSRVDRSADRMIQFKAPKDQVEYIESLGNADDRKAAWNKLSDRQKAEVLEYADSTAYTGNKGIFFDPKDGFHKAGSETYQKIEDERKKAKSAKAVKEAKEILGSPTSVSDAITAGKPIDAEVNKLGGDRVTSLSGEVLKHPAVAKHLTVSQLAAIMKDSSFDNVRNDIRQVIEKEHFKLTNTSGSVVPTNLAKAHNWLTNSASAGYNF